MGLLSRTKPAGANTTTTNFDLNDMGVMPTMKRQVLGNGMVLGLEQNSVWLYGKVPTAPVANARDAQQRLDAYGPLFQTLDQIAAETPRAALKRRSVTKNSYRNIHILRTNVPKTWHADTVAPRDRRQGQDTLNQWLNVSLPETTVKESVLALGVQLVPSTTSTGMKGALDSVVFTLLEGGTPLVDFERDLEKVKRIFDRTGLTALSGSEIASLDSWWNPGRNPDVVTLGHPDHLHVIRDKRTTRAIKKLEEDGVDCEDWPADIKESADQKAGQAVVSFGSISDVKLNFVDPVEDAELANWALPLLNARALAISIRGAVEPAEITREELRRNKRNYKNDITERVKNNKMERQEQEEKVGVLGQVESVYANSRGTPTLISTSGLVAFDGKVDDWDTVVRSAADLQAMEHRQSKAWAEMMICSMRNANPNLMDMPIQNIACSGINDVSRIGDKHGIMRGFTESDKQPAYYDVEAAYAITEDATMAINIGASGSGKSVALTTIVKTPGQSVTMGQLKVGDSVLGRDGNPCTVLSVHDEPEPEIFKITLSDGQVIYADAQHQWVVSGYIDRQRPRKQKHLAAQQNRKTLTGQINELHTLADKLGGELISLKEITRLVSEQTSIDRWSSSGVYASLRMVDAQPRGQRDEDFTMTVGGFEQQIYATVHDAEALLDAVMAGASARLEEHRSMVDSWRSAVRSASEKFTSETVTVRQATPELVAAGCGKSPSSLKQYLPKVMSEFGVASDGAKPPKAPRYGRDQFFEALASYEPGLHGHPVRYDVIDAAESLRGRLPQEQCHSRQMARWLIEAGVDMTEKELGQNILRWATANRVPGERAKVSVLHDQRQRTGRAGTPVQLYRGDEAMRLLAKRLEQIQGENGIALSTEERVLSTEEMIAEGLSAPNRGTNFAVRVCDPIAGTHRSLGLDPYVLGAWLGDGSHSSGEFANPDAFILDEIEAAGLEITRGSMDKDADPDDWYMHYIKGLVPKLREARVFGEKHIPWEYQTAAYDQRLAVLQGLMDSDGHVDLKGNCELSLSDQRLAEDALELIRSMGIKASVSWDRKAGYRDEAGEHVRTKDRHRIHFTTAAPVCRLPRKADRLPRTEDLRETHRWLYVESVEPAPSEPARCITVDSPDSTYLIEGFVPTHNTLLMQWEMFQTNLLGYPQICVDPKGGSNLTPVVEAMPNGRVYSLDELADHDGIFDGVKFSPNPDVAIEFALATITSLNPYGSDRDMAAAEPDLIEALRYGINRGHRSTLTALKRAVKDGKLDEHHVAQIEKLSTSSPMFTALVGHSDEGEGLGEFEGTTLIKVGDQELNLPEPGTPPSGIIQRVNLALVRNIVFASAMALNKRKGVLRLDEAWVFTSNSPRELERLGRLARSQTIDVQLYTQRISDALDANLRNYITRGLILHMRDPVEAKAACAVFDLEPTPERIGRIRAKGTLDNDSASPNWNSLKALKDPVTREVIRGSVGLYVDIHGRVVPVEIRVPERFLKLASTNIDDIQAREAQDAETSREAALAR